MDHNSNGRFDDTISLQSGGTAAEGDLLLVNPNPKNNLSADATMGGDRNFVSKTVCMGKSFYRMEIPPAGDSLKLTPTKLSLGSVTNPSPAYRAVLFCEDYGVLMLGGMKDQKIPLPAGTWQVINYTIDASGFAGGRGTAVAAKFGANPSTVTVTKGETAKLPFGAPFHAVVTGRRTSDEQGLAVAVDRRRRRRAVHQFLRQRIPAAAAAFRDQGQGRQERTPGQLRVWMRFHLPVLVASTTHRHRRVPSATFS